MFGDIAGRYDFMNGLITAGRHRKWRRLGAAAAGLTPGDKALDLCCGTGDFAFSLYDCIGPAGSVTGVDFSRRMLEVATEKSRQLGKPVDFRWGDATQLEFDDDFFTAVTVGFGVRNIPDLDGVFTEMKRVTRPGGRVVCLEITQPDRQPFKSFYRLWFDRIVPAAGLLISRNRDAYTYLPASVRRFPPAPELAAVMKRNGLESINYQLLAGGIIALHRGVA